MGGLLLVVTIILVFLGISCLSKSSVRVIGIILLTGAIFVGGEAFQSLLPVFCEKIFGKNGYILEFIILMIIFYYFAKYFIMYIKETSKK